MPLYQKYNAKKRYIFEKQKYIFLNELFRKFLKYHRLFLFSTDFKKE